jgi:hypothetical protein
VPDFRPLWLVDSRYPDDPTLVGPPVPRSLIGRILQLKALGASLDAVRGEIDCWENVLAEQSWHTEEFDQPQMLAETRDARDALRQYTQHTQRPIMSSKVLEKQATQDRFGRLAEFLKLELQLARVREEIDCWEETLEDQTRERELIEEAIYEPPPTDAFDSDPGMWFTPSGVEPAERNETSKTDFLQESAAPRATDHRASAIVAEPGAEMYPPVPPVDISHARVSAADLKPRSTHGVYGRDVDVVFEEILAVQQDPGKVPAINTMMTLGPSESATVRSNRPLQVTADAQRESTRRSDQTGSAKRGRKKSRDRSRPTMAAGVDVFDKVSEEVGSEWNETFGDVQDLHSIVRNQMDCWQERAEENQEAELDQVSTRPCN